MCLVLEERVQLRLEILEVEKCAQLPFGNEDSDVIDDFVSQLSLVLYQKLCDTAAVRGAHKSAPLFTSCKVFQTRPWNMEDVRYSGFLPNFVDHSFGKVVPGIPSNDVAKPLEIFFLHEPVSHSLEPPSKKREVGPMLQIRYLDGDRVVGVVLM